MPSDFTPLVQALKAKFPTGGTAFFTREASQPSRSDTAFFSAVSSPSQRSGDTTMLSAAAQSPHQAVQVETKRDNDRITQIKITCRCGELIEITCEY